jgi:hypothetical protein
MNEKIQNFETNFLMHQNRHVGQEFAYSWASRLVSRLKLAFIKDCYLVNV